jgi:hypothetical protein
VTCVPGTTHPHRLIVRAASILLLMAAARGAAGQSLVTGTVIDHATEEPIAIADLRITAAEGESVARTLSDDQGRFRMEVPGVGEYAISVSRVGYATIEAAGLHVEDDDELEIQVRLSPRAVVLEAVTVVTQRRAVWGRLGAFHDRARMQRTSGAGRIYLRDDLAGIGVVSIQWLIDAHPWRAGCQPAILLNGMPVQSPTFGLNPEHVEGLELYRDTDPIPAEFYRPGMCGLALIWTRADPSDRPWSWGRFAVAGLIVTIIALLAR